MSFIARGSGIWLSVPNLVMRAIDLMMNVHFDLLHHQSLKQNSNLSLQANKPHRQELNVLSQATTSSNKQQFFQADNNRPKPAT